METGTYRKLDDCSWWRHRPSVRRVRTWRTTCAACHCRWRRHCVPYGTRRRRLSGISRDSRELLTTRRLRRTRSQPPHLCCHRTEMAGIFFWKLALTRIPDPIQPARGSGPNRPTYGNKEGGFVGGSRSRSASWGETCQSRGPSWFSRPAQLTLLKLRGRKKREPQGSKMQN